MSETLDAYEKGVATTQTLGFIGWYSLPDPHVSHDVLTQKAKDAGMPLTNLPGKPRPADAFKRAMRKTDKTRNKSKPIPNDDRYYTFMVRPVQMKGKELEAHVVIEILDTDGKKLAHNEVASLRFNASTDFYENEIFPIYETHPDFRPLINDQLTEFLEAFKDAKVEVEPQAIRQTIRAELWDMNALTVRSRGGVYFVPVANKKRLDALETWVGALEADFHTLPLPDTTKQKNMVLAAFEADVHEQAHEVVQQLNKIISSGKKIAPSQWARHKKRLDDLTKRTRQYSDLVDEEMEKAGTELLLLQSKVMQVLNGDLVSEGR